jgi:predicted ATP-grasp superfamily ATP-dependent carboligase
VAKDIKADLNSPWMLAVWPGMGHVAVAAGYYLIARMRMSLLTEINTKPFFEVDHVDVKAGVIQPACAPRSRLFAWKAPNGQHDLLVLLSEGQPQTNKDKFSNHVMDLAVSLGVTRIFTLAAMATEMAPESNPRVFGMTTQSSGITEFEQLEVPVLEDGQVSGLNGILLAAAMERGIEGTGLLGEIPTLFAHFPFPAASIAVLRIFTTIANFSLDFAELQQQADSIKSQLGKLLQRLQQQMEKESSDDEESEDSPEAEARKNPERAVLSASDSRRIEQLFAEAVSDRSHAFELKNELDRLGVFAEFEDRFLDLFRAETGGS